MKESEANTQGYENVETEIEYNRKNDPELDPYEIEFLPEFRQGRGPREPFVNEHGVLIGDHIYKSEQSPLEQWSKETDPAIMSGDDWVHPYKDVGFHSSENREYFEQGIAPTSDTFMHPDKDVAYQAYFGDTEQDNDGEGPKRSRQADGQSPEVGS